MQIYFAYIWNHYATERAVLRYRGTYAQISFKVAKLMEWNLVAKHDMFYHSGAPDVTTGFYWSSHCSVFNFISSCLFLCYVAPPVTMFVSVWLSCLVPWMYDFNLVLLSMGLVSSSLVRDFPDVPLLFLGLEHQGNLGLLLVVQKLWKSSVTIIFLFYFSGMSASSVTVSTVIKQAIDAYIWKWKF